MQSPNSLNSKLNWADIEEYTNSTNKSNTKLSYSSIVNLNKQNNNNKTPTLTNNINNNNNNINININKTPTLTNNIKQQNNNNINKTTTLTNNIKQEKPSNLKKSKKCYTCKPRGKVLKHIINGTGSSEDVVFHYDLHKRPIILITPKKHYETIYEIPSNEIIILLDSIKTFCEFWHITDYQVSYNNGNWQTHPHFHIKIKANEKIINRMRAQHFRMHKLSNNYTPTKQ
jgi:hypothetical protein